MAELADALDSGSSERFVHAGSSPVSRTKQEPLKSLGFRGFFLLPVHTPGTRLLIRAWFEQVLCEQPIRCVCHFFHFTVHAERVHALLVTDRRLDLFLRQSRAPNGDQCAPKPRQHTETPNMDEKGRSCDPLLHGLLVGEQCV